MRYIVCALLAITFALGATAQIQIDITRSLGRTPVAVPDFAAAPGEQALGANLAQIMRNDLAFTGLFDILPQDRYPASFTGFTKDPQNIDFAAWGATRVEFLVHGYVTYENEKLVVELRLFDMLAGKPLLGRKLTTEKSWQRYVVHSFSDEIVRYLTGERGIATSQICFSGGQTGNKEIYVVDYDGANLMQATKHGSISILPRLSPDGKKIAYLSFKDRYPFLYVLDVETGVSEPLSKDVGLNVSPAWHPDGRRLAMALSKDGNSEIYLVDVDGTMKRRLTENRDLDTSPAFHPGGERLAFVSDRMGSAQIFSMDLDGTNVQRLSYQGGQSYSPQWSPDGKKIAYVVEKGGEGNEIYVMDADGRNPKQLTNSSGSNESPSWSADSRHVVFSSSRGGQSQLWTVTVETGEEHRVPGLNLQCQGPSWGPRRELN